MNLLERVRHVKAVWNWLPAFRAVAETQHIHKAARLLSVSPSALSRMIRLLEEELGEQLFERRGRMLHLNAAGDEFLTAVRDSIRRVDDGISRVTSGELAGPVYILSASSVVDAFLVPALSTLRDRNSKLIPHLHRFPAEDVCNRILGGQLDIAFLLGSAVHRRLTVEQLGYATSGIYCGRRNPFFGAQDVPLASIFGQTFTVIVSPGTEKPCDGWSADHPRKIGMCVSDLGLACQACQEGNMLVALPDAVVRLNGLSEHLHRLPVNVLAEIPMSSIRRPTLSRYSSSETIISAVKEEIERGRGLGIRPPQRGSVVAFDSASA